MREKRLIRFVGYLQTAGRPKDVCCNGWYPNKLEHEVRLTRALLPMLKTEPLRVERGPFVDDSYRADADVFFPAGDIWRFEFDTGSQNYKQIATRWEVYQECPDFVLVLTCRKSLKELKEKAIPYADIMHFAAYAEFLKNPWGNVLQDIKGEDCSLRESME